MADPPLDSDEIARLRLIRTPSIGPMTFAQLLARFGTAAAALEAVPGLAQRGGGRSPKLASVSDIEREMARVRAFGARYLLLGHSDYPPMLAEIEDAPPVLIVAGDDALAFRPGVAVVGARNASAAAIRFARQIAHDLGRAGVTVVSGLARGIDTAAHTGSIASGTIGVVAGGIDVFYPPENEALQRAVAERGLLVAEQPPGTEPRARHFPYRNRIILGIAATTLVVEAALRSGSLITVRLANEQGRDVLAVPGSPLDPRAQGCNQLIRDGATLIQTADDVLAELRPFSMRVAAPRTTFHAAAAADASARERDQIIALLSPMPVPVDELMRLAGLPPASVQLVLLELELAGRLDRHAGGEVSLVTPGSQD